MDGATEGAVVKKLQGPSDHRFFLVADESNKENFGNLKENRHILRKKS
jgi:hypothetical protein